MLELEMKDGNYIFDEGNVKYKTNKRVRGFEKVSYAPVGTKLPERKTEDSSCYDMYMPYGLTIGAGCISKPIMLNVKAYMQPREVLEIQMRSSMAMKKHLFMLNSPAKIDADYYNCEENEGNISIVLVNAGDSPVTLEKGERIVQANFTTYLLADNDKVSAKRKGGVGSTGK